MVEPSASEKVPRISLEKAAVKTQTPAHVPAKQPGNPFSRKNTTVAKNALLDAKDASSDVLSE